MGFAVGCFADEGVGFEIFLTGSTEGELEEEEDVEEVEEEDDEELEEDVEESESESESESEVLESSELLLSEELLDATLAISDAGAFVGCLRGAEETEVLTFFGGLVAETEVKRFEYVFA